MKELEFSVGRSIGGGFLLVGLAPEPRITGEGSPRLAPLQNPQISIRPWVFAFPAVGLTFGRGVSLR